jgi:hypothetical protein
MGIRFNANGCITALAKVLTRAVLGLRREFKDYVASEYAKSGLPEVDLDDGTVKEIAGYISAQIVGGPWSVLSEFGSGSLMDKTNPALTGYMNSGLWNPARTGYEKVGRPKGRYTDFFGTERYSSGAREGRSVEDNYPPTPPTHGMTVTAAWMFHEQRPQRVIREILRTFPWGDFIVVKE